MRSAYYALDYRSSLPVQKKYCIPHLFKTGSNIGLEVARARRYECSRFQEFIVILPDIYIYTYNRRHRAPWIMDAVSFFAENAAFVQDSVPNPIIFCWEMKKQPGRVVKGISWSRTPSCRSCLEIFVKKSDELFVFRFCLHIFYRFGHTI